MERRTGNSILGKAVLFVFLVIFITAIGGLLPLTAGKKIKSKKVKAQRPLVSTMKGKSIKLRFASGEFDPLMEPRPDELTKRLAIHTYAQGETGYYLVQFEGPIRANQKNKLRKLGAQVFDYLPDFAFIVKMNDKTRAAVESVQQVRWVGIYQPAYKIEPALAETMMARETYLAEEFIVTLFPGEDPGSIAQKIEQFGGEVLETSEYGSRVKLKIQLGLESLETVSKINGVKWIEEAPVWKFHNNVAAGIMDAYDVWNTHNLYGAGQTVAVADTGLDQGSEVPANLHDDFEDGSGASRILQIIDRVGDGADDVNSGHGTHVAGSVLGNGALSGSNPAASDYSNANAYIGVAPEATLVFQALENNITEALSGIPSDLNTLFNQAQGAGATIHTNSWGSSQAGAYTSFSEDVDEFVWNNRDFLILFAAGNDGVDADGNGVIDPISMGSPATAKNCITVGASENNRPNGSTPTPGANINWGMGWPFDYPIDPINSDHVSDEATGMAAFSSRGPCLDGRVKPDIVAPGTNIVSTKSSATGSTLWGQGLDLAGTQYTFSGGTSMSTPLVAGAAALVREFYTNVPITPSAALIKATLLNGAFDMSPGQYGPPPGPQEIPAPPRPNNVEGWGRVDLEPSIFPTAPKILRYADIAAGLNTGESRIYNFTVGNNGTVPLKATLVWSDYPGSPIAGGGLVNDLDLILIDPSSNRKYPNNSTQSDRINNVVGIDIPSPTTTGSYSIRVEGYNVAQGPQPYALVVTGDTLSALTELTPPVAPSNLSASSSSLTEVSLSWSDTPNEAGYRIERKTGAGGTYNLITIPPLAADVTSYTDTTCSEATTYYYRMTAYNAQGDSMYSSEVNATTLPAAPGGLSAAAASSSIIDLSWTDNSNGETGYKIERKIGAGGTYIQVDTVGANVTSYSNTGLIGSKTYYYHVMAYNVTGDSVQSNEANATTPASPSLASSGGGGGGCFIATSGFGSHFDRSADFIGEHESGNAQQISVGLALLAALCFVTFRRRCRS